MRELDAELAIGACVGGGEYYIETGKPLSAPLGGMGKGLEAANNVNTGTSIVGLLADHERSYL